jgi:hypothetical protein
MKGDPVSCLLVIPVSVNLFTWRLVAGFPPRQPEFDRMSGHVGFVVDNMSVQVFPKYFYFPC